jgi:hypothetical protein
MLEGVKRLTHGSSWLHWAGSDDESKPPFWFKQRSSRWFIVLTCSYTVFVVRSPLCWFLRRWAYQSEQDIFLYGVVRYSGGLRFIVLIPIKVVPVLPFALRTRVGVPSDEGNRTLLMLECTLKAL